MAITFKSAGHALATFFKNVVAEAKKEAPVVAADLVKAEGTKTVVEATTGAILASVSPAAAATAVGIEDAGYAVLGEVSNLLSAGGEAAAQKLIDAGLDKDVVNAVKNVAAGASQVITLVKAAK